MTNVMTPSEITSGQIGKINDLFAARLRASGLPAGAVQQVLEQAGGSLASELVAVVRTRVELVSGVIIRRVRVNRLRSPQETIAATGRRQYLNDSVVAAMPRGEGDEVDVHFFKESRYLSDSALDEAFAKRGLKPADPYSMLAVDEGDPALADDYPHGTHWRDADGKWCYAACYRWRGGREVFVNRYGLGWGDDWGFAGLPQGSSASAL